MKQAQAPCGSTRRTSTRWNILRLSLALCLSACCGFCLGSTELYLKDGSILKGNFLSQSNRLMRFDVNFTVMDIPVTNVDHMVNIPDQQVRIIRVDGTVVKGLFIYQDFEKIKVVSSGRGELVIFKTNVKSLDWQNGVEPDPQPVVSPKSDPDVLVLRVYWQAGWRSMVLPSWGQFYKKDKARGIITAFLNGASLGTAVTGLIGYAGTKGKYDANPSDQLYRTTIRWKETATVAFSLFLLSYGVTALDAFFAEPAHGYRGAALNDYYSTPDRLTIVFLRRYL